MFEDDWITIYAKGENYGIAFQQNDLYLPSTWAEEQGAQQIMVHFDFAVADLDGSVKYATSLGAVKAEIQYYPN